MWVEPDYSHLAVPLGERFAGLPEHQTAVGATAPHCQADRRTVTRAARDNCRASSISTPMATAS
jgi:hypothetical protein